MLTLKDSKTTQRYAHLVDESIKKVSRVNEDIIAKIIDVAHEGKGTRLAEIG